MAEAFLCVAVLAVVILVLAIFKAIRNPGLVTQRVRQLPGCLLGVLILFLIVVVFWLFS